MFLKWYLFLFFYQPFLLDGHTDYNSTHSWSFFGVASLFRVYESRKRLMWCVVGLTVFLRLPNKLLFRTFYSFREKHGNIIHAHFSCVSHLTLFFFLPLANIIYEYLLISHITSIATLLSPSLFLTFLCAIIQGSLLWLSSKCIILDREREVIFQNTRY